MCKKLIYLASFVLVMGLVLSSVANAAALPGLIGWYKLDEMVGTTAFDSSGLGNDGHFGPEGDPQWVAGYFGGAVDLDGSDDYIEINSIADDIPTDNNFSVMAWIKTTQTGDGNVIGANTTGSSHDFIFGVDQNVLLVEADTINRYPPIINDGVWHHIAYVRNGNNAYAYTDGVLVGTETPSGDPSAMARWSIG
ncbi:MAG: LamG-like jellyroll fold domain-containing protein, partial [Sedimentisphaerales bacterium]